MLKLLQSLIVKQLGATDLIGELAKSVFGTLGWVHVEGLARPFDVGHLANDPSLAVMQKCVLCGRALPTTSHHLRSPDGKEFAHWDTLCWARAR